MLRLLFIAVLFIASGPLVAFALLTIGCSGSSPLLGVGCGHNAILTFVVLAFGTWLVVAVAFAVVSARRTLQ